MEFQVPQFIERETKIVGALTFKQFLFVGGAGTVIFILYFSLAKTNFLLFLVATIFLAGGALLLAFLKIGGRSLPIVLGNFFIFFVSSRFYLWKKKAISPKIIKKEERLEKEEVKKGPYLGIAEKSQLKKLSTLIETRMR